MSTDADADKGSGCAKDGKGTSYDDGCDWEYSLEGKNNLETERRTGVDDGYHTPNAKTAPRRTKAKAASPAEGRRGHEQGRVGPILGSDGDQPRTTSADYEQTGPEAGRGRCPSGQDGRATARAPDTQRYKGEASIFTSSVVGGGCQRAP
ncbi:hypothetical protein ON010_g3440 [Phytophthora cinnamomi]|nr:hypothetical protein ON010_g3440 [Phytophthora cinnamomi]